MQVVLNSSYSPFSLQNAKRYCIYKVKNILNFIYHDRSQIDPSFKA